MYVICCVACMHWIRKLKLKLLYVPLQNVRFLIRIPGRCIHGIKEAAVFAIDSSCRKQNVSRAFIHQSRNSAYGKPQLTGWGTLEIASVVAFTNIPKSMLFFDFWTCSRFCHHSDNDDDCMLTGVKRLQR